MGLRAHDHRAVPLCRLAHIDIEQHAGAFIGWSKGVVARWCAATASDFRDRYLHIQESDFPR